MNIIELSATPDAAMTGKLKAFESQFSYPLGETRRFSISHLPDYTAFYRSQGEPSVCLLALTDRGEIAGTVSASIRTLKSPMGRTRTAAYIGDLKVTPQLKKQGIFFALAKALKTRLEPLTNAAYGVVMDGTSALPSSYSGRMGLPLFVSFAPQYVLHLSTDNLPEAEAEIVDESTGRDLYEQLSRGGYAFPAGNPSLKSSMVPRWYTVPGTACGMLEDTRKAKRLFADDGTEMLSSHLAYFAALDGRTGRNVIVAALKKSWELGFRAMFLTLDDDDMRLLEPHMNELAYSNAPATIYATETLHPGRMKVNSSEI